MASHRFSQKMKGRILFACYFTFHWKQMKFLFLFFRRIYGSTICFSIIFEHPWPWDVSIAIWKESLTKLPVCDAFWQVIVCLLAGARWKHWKFFSCANLIIVHHTTFSNFSCMFLNPNILFQFEYELFYFIISEEPPERS